MDSLASGIALVTGASRGIGRGVALALAEAGATVFITGRTLRPGGGALPGSLEETAAEIEARGGRPVPVACDHGDDEAVAALFARIEKESGGLDVLVNNVFAVPEGPVFGTPFWEQPASMWDAMHRVGLRSHYVCAQHAARLMVPAGRGLIANISSFGGAGYQVNVAYGVGKAAVDRLSRDMAKELRPHRVASVSLWPGVVRTERLVALAESGASPFDMSITESPELTGRVIAALAGDPDRLSRTGKVGVVAELARDYGIADTDGSAPTSLRAPAGDDLVDRARAMREELAAGAAETEARRRLSPERAGELARAGMFRMLVPKKLGGLEVHPGAFTRVLEELARGDAAASWCVMTGATTALTTAYMPPEGARELLADPEAIMAGVFAPIGRATPVEGGYRVSGRWPFASNCENARWRLGGALVVEGDGVRKTASGAPDVLSVMFPAADTEIIDTWSVSGLCGTGSHDIAADDVFVPEARTCSLLSAEPRYRRPLYCFPVFGLLASGVAAVALGIGRAALGEIVRLAGEKSRGGSRKKLAQSELVQVELARAEGELAAGRSLLRDTLSRVHGRAEREGAIDDRDKADVRMAACHATTAAVRAVDAAYKLGGGTSLYRSSPLQRHLRDIRTVTQHIMVGDGAARMVGQVALDVGGDRSQL